MPYSSRRTAAALGGGSAMVLVGGSAAVSALLAAAPLMSVQALRYGVAAVLLLVVARSGRRALRRPRGAEWAWLAGVTGSGLVLFNVALVRGAAHAEPAVFGVAVASVPLVLALLGPVLDGHPPSARLWLAAGAVTVGAVLVVGLGRSDGTGLAWAVLVLGCEAGFTLLAVPVLRRHGPWGVSVHATWMAALVFAVLGVLTDGPGALAGLTAGELLATAYLAVGVTAVAFVLWYGSVRTLGAGRAGLLTGIAPIAAALAGTALGLPAPGPVVWLGIGVVVGGLALGLTASRPDVPAGTPSRQPARRCDSRGRADVHAGDGRDPGRPAARRAGRDALDDTPLA